MKSDFILLPSALCERSASGRTTALSFALWLRKTSQGNSSGMAEVEPLGETCAHFPNTKQVGEGRREAAAWIDVACGCRQNNAMQEAPPIPVLGLILLFLAMVILPWLFRKMFL